VCVRVQGYHFQYFLQKKVSWFYCFCGAILDSYGGKSCSAWQWVIQLLPGVGNWQFRSSLSANALYCVMKNKFLRNLRNLNLSLQYFSYYRKLIKTTIEADTLNWLKTSDDNLWTQTKQFCKCCKYLSSKGMINRLPKLKLDVPFEQHISTDTVKFMFTLYAKSAWVCSYLSPVGLPYESRFRRHTMFFSVCIQNKNKFKGSLCISVEEMKSLKYYTSQSSIFCKMQNICGRRYSDFEQ
jgi:hypothetical protein